MAALVKTSRGDFTTEEIERLRNLFQWQMSGSIQWDQVDDNKLWERAGGYRQGVANLLKEVDAAAKPADIPKPKWVEFGVPPVFDISPGNRRLYGDADHPNPNVKLVPLRREPAVSNDDPAMVKYLAWREDYDASLVARNAIPEPVTSNTYSLPKPDPVPFRVGDIWVVAAVGDRDEQEIVIDVVAGDQIGFRGLPNNSNGYHYIITSWLTRTNLLEKMLGDRPVGWMKRGWFGRQRKVYGERPQLEANLDWLLLRTTTREQSPYAVSDEMHRKAMKRTAQRDYPTSDNCTL